MWRVGAPARALLVAGVHLYRATLSGLVGGQCRFHPTCSHYAEVAIRTHGALRGSVLAGWRILRCGPFTRGGVDYVPAQGEWVSAFRGERAENRSAGAESRSPTRAPS